MRYTNGRVYFTLLPSYGKELGTCRCSLYFFMPPPRRGEGGGIKRSSASVVRPSVRSSVCLMSRTSALTRKPKGLGRRNFAQRYPRSHATPTPTSRSKGQIKVSRGGAGAYCGGHLAPQLVYFILVCNVSDIIIEFCCNTLARLSRDVTLSKLHFTDKSNVDDDVYTIVETHRMTVVTWAPVRLGLRRVRH